MTARFFVISSGFFIPFIDHLPTDGVMIGLLVNNKKRLLEQISVHAKSPTKMPAEAVFDVVIKRKRLISAGIGGGMAIPYAVFAAAKHPANGAIYKALRSAKTTSDIRHYFDQYHTTAA